jgi:hypothetical protein
MEIMKIGQLQTDAYFEMDEEWHCNASDPLILIFTSWIHHCGNFTIDARPIISRLAIDYMGVDRSNVKSFLKEQQEVNKISSKMAKQL